MIGYNQSASPERLLTLTEAQDMLRIGRHKLYQLMNSGRLRVIRLGERTVRVPASEVDRVCRLDLPL